MDDDEDDEEFGGLFENGHWVWDEIEDELRFHSDAPPVQEEVKIVFKKAPTGTIEFRDDIDLIEQDCKDLAIYTAPVAILSSDLIRVLHCPTTERLIRALILYCQIFLQIQGIMKQRMAELKTKVRTPICLEKERDMRNDLADIRVLVAKEYCTFIVGGADLRKFHHMGKAKKSKSLSDKDARLMETLLRVFIQIIWLALARKAFNIIELEVQRLFKSELFNITEHRLKTNYVKSMPAEEYSTLFGLCNIASTKLYQKSPLYNEVFCHDTGFRLTGLGVTGFEEQTTRLEFLEAAIAAPEESLAEEHSITLGILGLPRGRFDTMLNEIKMDGRSTVAGSSSSTHGKSKASFTKKSNVKMSKSKAGSKKGLQVNVYQNIYLPPRNEQGGVGAYFPASYPDLPPTYPIRQCNKQQETRWLKRFEKLTQTYNKRK